MTVEGVEMAWVVCMDTRLYVNCCQNLRFKVKDCFPVKDAKETEVPGSREDCEQELKTRACSFLCAVFNWYCISNVDYKP